MLRFHSKADTRPGGADGTVRERTVPGVQAWILEPSLHVRGAHGLGAAGQASPLEREGSRQPANNEHGCIPGVLPLQKQALGQVWPAGCSSLSCCRAVVSSVVMRCSRRGWLEREEPGCRGGPRAPFLGEVRVGEGVREDGRE